MDLDPGIRPPRRCSAGAGAGGPPEKDLAGPPGRGSPVVLAGTHLRRCRRCLEERLMSDRAPLEGRPWTFPPARRLVLQSLQSLDRLPTRRGTPVYHRDGRMVGYAVLGPDAKPSRSSGTFRRRVFRLLPHDRDAVPDGLYTTGAPGGGGGPAHDRAPEQKAQGRAFRGRTATLGHAFRLIRGRPSPLHLPISRFFLGGSRVPSTGSDRLRSTPHCKQTAKWRGVRRKQRAWDPPSTVNSRALLELPEILLADLLSWDPRPYF